MFGIGCGFVVLFHMAVIGASAIVLLGSGAWALYRPAESTRWAHCGVAVAALGGLFAAVPIVQVAFAVWALIFLGITVGVGLARTRLQVLGGSAAFVTGEIGTILASFPEIRAERIRMCAGHAQWCLGHAVGKYTSSSCGYEGVGYFAGLGFVVFVIVVHVVLIVINLLMSWMEGRAR